MTDQLTISLEMEMDTPGELHELSELREDNARSRFRKARKQLDSARVVHQISPTEENHQALVVARTAFALSAFM